MSDSQTSPCSARDKHDIADCLALHGKMLGLALCMGLSDHQSLQRTHHGAQGVDMLMEVHVEEEERLQPVQARQAGLILAAVEVVHHVSDLRASNNRH